MSNHDSLGIPCSKQKQIQQATMERNTLEYFLEYFTGANMTFRGSLVLAEIIEVMFFAGTLHSQRLSSSTLDLTAECFNRPPSI